MEEIAFTAAMRQTADGLFLLEGLDGETRRQLWAQAPRPVRFEKGEAIYSCHAFPPGAGASAAGRGAGIPSGRGRPPGGDEPADEPGRSSARRRCSAKQNPM